MRWRTELIKGMGRRGEEFIIILNIGAVFSLAELSAVQATADETRQTPA
jgi:purine-binding chemotaxis protein CheW